jgi:hypothetical protein
MVGIKGVHSLLNSTVQVKPGNMKPLEFHLSSIYHLPVPEKLTAGTMNARERLIEKLHHAAGWGNHLLVVFLLDLYN